MADTIKDLRTDIHKIDVRLSTVEAVGKERHDTLMAAILELREDLSDAGRTPAGTERGPTRAVSVGSNPRPMLFGIVPGTAKELAPMVVILASLLSAIGGVSYIGAQSGGSTGATQAVEEAVGPLPVGDP